MSAIKFGAWGLGRIGFVHAKHFAAQTGMYELVAGCDVEQPKVETAHHLYRALREGKPFPIANADALEVARIIQVVKDRNPEFRWDFERQPME